RGPLAPLNRSRRRVVVHLWYLFEVLPELTRAYIELDAFGALQGLTREHLSLWFHPSSDGQNRAARHDTVP
ncbi:MAG TPA: hypothetical protein PK384_13195, partial [Candidatus Latescibacteria bacterium]|nr:hypothetical protein [Candidatus Latescibacterota bacterium]